MRGKKPSPRRKRKRPARTRTHVSRSLDPDPRHGTGSDTGQSCPARQVAPKTLRSVDWVAVPGMHPRPVCLPHPEKWHLDFNSVTSYQASGCRRPRSWRCCGGGRHGRRTPAPLQLDRSVDGRKMGRRDDGDSASGPLFAGSLGPRSVYGRNGMPNALVEGSFQAPQVRGAAAIFGTFLAAHRGPRASRAFVALASSRSPISSGAAADSFFFF